MHIASRLTIFLLAVVLFAPCVAAQQIDSGAHPGERIYVDAVVSSGPDGPPVENLQQRDFTVFDNGIPQTIASFEENGWTGLDATQHLARHPIQQSPLHLTQQEVERESKYADKPDGKEHQ